MPWTPLHAALGESSPILDLALIQRACEEKVRERADLDWKRDLPLTAPKEQAEARSAQQLELAKDVAAMANSGGGMIVYGVEQVIVDGEAAAGKIVPVGEVDDGITRQIRQVAGNLVYPPVTETQLLALHPEGSPESGVLALLVPRSLERPHLIRPPKGGKDWFAVPYRHGAETEWMVERQISSAYVAREAGRRSREADFDDRFSEFVEASTTGDSSGPRYVLAMAAPDEPERVGELSVLRADAIFDSALNRQMRAAVGPLSLTTHEVTRRGLRRYERRGQQGVGGVPSSMRRARVLVHADGAVGAAFTRDGAFIGEGKLAGQVSVLDIEQTALDMFNLLWAAREELGLRGDYRARIAVSPSTQIFRRRDPAVLDHHLPFDESQRIFSYRPISDWILAGEGLEPALETWVSAIKDAVNQAGSPTSVDINKLLEPWD